MLKESICKEIVEKLEWMDDDVYNSIDDPSDLAFTLWERENIDGSCTYSTYEAIQWIKENFEDLGEIVEEYQADTGVLLNPFSNPEAFQVTISIEVTARILWEKYKKGMTKEELIDALQ